MIEKLNTDNSSIAEEVLRISLEAYRTEANLLGIADFPPLSESLVDIIRSKNNFFGFTQNGELSGVIEVEEKVDIAIIARLVVSPNRLRQGVASTLLSHVIDQTRDFAVSTALGKTPAIKLYKNHGFVKQRERRSELSDLQLVTLYRRCVAGKNQ